MKRKFAFFALLLLTAIQVWAQNRTVTGKVTDQKTGQPLVGVTVSSGSTNALTDGAGTYRISVPAAAKTISFMFVGYDRIELPIRGAVVNASLNPETKSLEEVVVTGYSRERKTQFAGAASVISAKAVETVPVGSFDQALQGRAPGMLVNSSSGQPGNSPT
ncbi:MAG: carboxypeptidase-like regulatory domain-containing protein, partial [Sediminibacterium sp.]